MKTDTTITARGNGHAPSRGVRDMTIEPPAANRRVRVPELLIGAALTVGFALAAVLWHANSTQREPALALATDVTRGETITAQDLRVVYIGTDDVVTRLRPSQSPEVIGRVAVADLREGTLVTSSNVVNLPSLGPSDGVVGLALDPGQFPAGRIGPGDVVNVVAPGEGEPTLLAEGASVYAVEDLGSQGRKFISLRTDESSANRVAAAAEAGPVRLVLVGS